MSKTGKYPPPDLQGVFAKKTGRLEIKRPAPSVPAAPVDRTLFENVGMPTDEDIDMFERDNLVLLGRKCH